LVEISLFRSLRGTRSRTHPPSMAYSACWRSHTSELDLALARRLSSCGRRRSPAARTLTNCTCGEGAAALLAVAKAVGEGGTLYSSPTRWRWRWHMQPAQLPTRSCLIRIWMASRLCPLSCVRVWRAIDTSSCIHNRYKNLIYKALARLNEGSKALLQKNQV
jgi:hypothetical protein